MIEFLITLLLSTGLTFYFVYSYLNKKVEYFFKRETDYLHQFMDNFVEEYQAKLKENEDV